MPTDDGDRAWQYLDALAAITDEPPGLTRTFLSPAHAHAKRQLAEWMQAAGMQVFEDAAGNLIGRLSAADPEAPVIVCGSHIDTVRNAGRFDGALGVVLGVVAASRIARQQQHLKAHLEIVAFSDEEGVRFGSTYLGSKFYAGTLRDADMTAHDDSGMNIREVMAAHHPEFPLPPQRTSIAAYVEAHIEQGPVLENTGIALGVATAIAGQTRARVFIDGLAGHAGTTPMHMRRDALAGAAACITMIERMAADVKDLVGTVGDIRVRGGAGNVIAGHVEFPVDVRHADNDVRMGFCRNLFSEIERELASRELGCRIEFPMVQPAARCSTTLTEALVKAVELQQNGKCPRMVSGAGHDVAAVAAVAETALLFVRCRGGLSHHPDEYATPADVALALDVVSGFLEDLVL